MFTNGNSVADSDALAALAVPDNIAVGTRIFNLDVGADFIYTVSDAALDPDVVVEVAGITGARWIVSNTGTGSVESVTGDGVDNTDPANPVIDLDDTIETGFIQDGAVTSGKLGAGVPHGWSRQNV